MNDTKLRTYLVQLIEQRAELLLTCQSCKDSSSHQQYCDKHCKALTAKIHHVSLQLDVPFIDCGSYLQEGVEHG